MTISMPVRQPLEISLRLILLVTIAFSLIGLPWARLDRQAAQGSSAVAAAAAELTRSLLQFKAGSHILAFQPHQVVMAGLDHALTVEFVDAAPGVAPVSGQSAAGSMTRGVQALSLVTYTGLWQGIDLKYESARDGVAKSTYTLAPGADAGLIRLRYNVPLALQPDGSLQFQVQSQRGSLSETAPIAWQEIGGSRHSVPVSFQQLSETMVGFSLGAYDPHIPLIIDPFYEWHTFLGSPSYDTGRAVAVDAAGNIYIAGSLSGTLWQNFDYGYGAIGGSDMEVVKLDSAGTFQWGVELGGIYTDAALGIAVNGAAVYVTGESDTNWKYNNQNPLHAYTGSGFDMVVVKLDSAGAYQWHTFYSSIHDDQAMGIVVDANGVYLTGYSDFTWNGPAPSNASPLHAFTGSASDIFVLKLSSAGLYQWHTFYGGVGYEYANALALDSLGFVYVTGSSSAAWTGPASHAPVHAYTGGYDLFALKLDSNGLYQWHTFFGSSQADDAQSIAVIGTKVLIGGSSNATWNGKPSNGTPLHGFGVGQELVVLALDLNGAYQWHTFYGGVGSDSASGITGDANGSIYLAGSSTAAWGSPLHAYGGGMDILALKLDSNGALLWNTFFGTKGGDEGGHGVALDASGNVLLAGDTAGEWPLASLNPYLSGSDMAVVKLNASGVYQWHTFLSSVVDESAQDVAIDASGNIYIAGRSAGSWGSPLHAYNNLDDIVIVKLNSSGSELWHTYYGSGDSDYAAGLVLDAAGNVYITGSSSAAWDGPAPDYFSPLHAYTGATEIFVLKLDKNGGYLWHTFYGSSTYDFPYAIALDKFGFILVTGDSNASWTGDSSSPPKNPYTGSNDIFVLKLSLVGNYQWHTFFGGAGYDYPSGIAADPSGNIIVAGSSYAAWTGPGSVSPLHAFAGGSSDICVIKLNALGVYQWHTFFGGSGAEYTRSLALDSGGSIYTLASSSAAWQGQNNANPKTAFHGNEDITLLKLDKNGAYQWHTFFGSSLYDNPGKIVLDGKGNLWIVGDSMASWGVPLHPHSGGDDIFVLKTSLNGDLLWNSFYGTPGTQSFGHAIATDSSGTIVAVGSSGYTGWKVDSNSPLHSYLDGFDMTVLKLHDLDRQVYLPAILR